MVVQFNYSTNNDSFVFSITGYVFNDCEGNQKLFYTKLFKYLVFPWLCLAFLKGSINALINRSFEYFLEYSSNLLQAQIYGISLVAL